MDVLTWILLGIFLLSGSYLGYVEYQKRTQIQAQFVITGCFLTIVTIVCFLSAICTILNFIWRWIL
jgi:hypothetical protein